MIFRESKLSTYFTLHTYNKACILIISQVVLVCVVQTSDISTFLVLLVVHELLQFPELSLLIHQVDL